MADDISAAANNVGLAPMGTQSAVAVAAGQTARDGSFSKPGQVNVVSPTKPFKISPCRHSRRVPPSSTP
jgi:hypothetical protein